MPARTTQQHTVPCEAFNDLNLRFAGMTEQMAHFTEWETRQNGSLGKMAATQDELRADLNRSRDERRTQITALEDKMVKRMEDARLQVDARFERTNAWLTTLLGSAVLSLLLLVANLVITLARG